MFVILQVILYMEWSNVMILCEDVKLFLNLARTLWMQANDKGIKVGDAKNNCKIISARFCN